MKTILKPGTKIKFSTTLSDGGILSYTARIVKPGQYSSYWVEIPERVRNIPFPPNDGKRFALYSASYCEKWQVVSR